MPNHQLLLGIFVAAVALLCAAQAQPADKPIKAFILAGQSNMVGWGDSTMLPDELRKGNDRDIEKHPANVHYKTAGQLKVGKLFAEAFLEQVGHGFKVYISTDMEGCSGVTCSEQVFGEEGKQLMTGDMKACIEGCFAAGATEVVIRDHHGGPRAWFAVIRRGS